MASALLVLGVPTLFNNDFPRLFHDQKMKIHDVSTQHIFPNKLYMTYECMSGLVVTVSAAHHTTVKKTKPPVYLHIFTNVSQQSAQHDLSKTSENSKLPTG